LGGVSDFGFCPIGNGGNQIEIASALAMGIIDAN